MHARQMLRAMAWGRAAIGASLLLAPGATGAAWLGQPARSRPGMAAVRAIGGRDVAIALGTLMADRREQPLAGWAAASALADGSDGLATLLAYRELPRRTRIPVLLTAAGTAAAEVAAGLLLVRAAEGDKKQKTPQRPVQPPSRHTGRIGTVPG